MKHHQSSIKLAGFLALGAFALIQGCSDDEPNDKPNTNIPIDTGGKASGGKSSGGSGKSTGAEGGFGATNTGDGGTGATNTGDGGTGATNTGDGGSGDGGTGPIDPPKCDLPETGTNGCFNCPTDNVTVEWLNRCVAGVNYDNDFDNATRVPRLPADGKLPPFAN